MSVFVLVCMRVCVWWAWQNEQKTLWTD